MIFHISGPADYRQSFPLDHYRFFYHEIVGKRHRLSVRRTYLVVVVMVGKEKKKRRKPTVALADWYLNGTLVDCRLFIAADVGSVNVLYLLFRRWDGLFNK